MDQEKEARKTVEKLQSQLRAKDLQDWIKEAKRSQSGALVLCKVIPASDEGMKALRDLADLVKAKDPNSVVAFGMEDAAAQKVSVLLAVGPKAAPAFDAGAKLKEIAPLFDGKGGGKRDMAQAGGTKIGSLQGVFAQVSDQWLGL
jgi:alanyl-tRNA synthetase